MASPLRGSMHFGVIFRVIWAGRLGIQPVSRYVRLGWVQ